MTRLVTFTLMALASGIIMTGCQNKNPSLKSNKDKASYAIGWRIGQDFKAQGLDANPDIVAIGIADALAKKEKRITDEEMRGAMMALREESQKKVKEEGKMNSEIGSKFLETNKAKEGVKTTESGLQYMVMTEGKGDKAKKDSQVKVHYKGTLIDGTEFDSSYSRNQPATFPVHGVIKGWQEALQLMNQGAKYKLFIPSELAYGERGTPGIPANSVLIFEVELLEILK